MTRRRVPSSTEAVTHAYGVLASERVLGVIARGLRARGEVVDFQPPEAPGVADPQGTGRLATGELAAGVGASITASAFLGHDVLPARSNLVGVAIADYFTPTHGDWRLAALHGLFVGGLATTADGARRLDPRQHRRIRELVRHQDAEANHWLGSYSPYGPTLHELATAPVSILLETAIAAVEWHGQAAGKLAEVANVDETADIHRLAMDIALEALSGPAIERGLSAS